MKIMKKIICLTMSVIMLFTGTPMLQAGDLVLNLDKEQMAELQQEISQQVNKEKDPVNKLMTRYQYAKKNIEARLQEINNVELTAEQQKAVEEYVNQLKEKAEELAKTEEYVLFVPESQRKAVAFNSLLFLDLENLDRDVILIGNVMILAGIIIWIIDIIIEYIPLWLWDVGAYLVQGGIVIIIGGLLLRFFSGAYTPSIAPAFDEKEVFRRFTEKPFAYLADFDKKNKKFEYANVYGKSQRCAQALNDAVDIEYYVSANPNNFENAKDKLYVGTIDWYEMEPEARAEYLHTFAERLRTEAKAKTQEYNNSHNYKIGLAEK